MLAFIFMAVSISQMIGAVLFHFISSESKPIEVETFIVNGPLFIAGATMLLIARARRRRTQNDKRDGSDH